METALNMFFSNPDEMVSMVGAAPPKNAPTPRHDNNKPAIGKSTGLRLSCG